MHPSATAITSSNSYTHVFSEKSSSLDTVGGGVRSSSNSFMLNLDLGTLRRSIRSTSTFDQRERYKHADEMGGEDVTPSPYAWPATAMAIQNGATTDLQGHTQGYDLLILGTHASIKARQQRTKSGVAPHVLFVTVLPHIQQDVNKNRSNHVEPSSSSSSSSTHEPFSLFHRSVSHGGGGDSSQPPQPPTRSVVLHSTYGELLPPQPPPSASTLAGSDLQRQRRRRRRICGRRGINFGALFHRIFDIVTHPLAALHGFLFGSPLSSSSILPSPPNVLPHHYPKLVSLADHGLILEEEPWPWKDQPFFGIDLTWEQTDDEEKIERALDGVGESDGGEGVGRSPRHMPIHPSHICLDPLSGEVIITDHERHAVYSLIPCWIMHQRLLELMNPSPPPVPSMVSESESSSLTPADGVNDDGWCLPLPSVLLDLVVGYLGNQVRLLAGESNVKGCRDGVSDAAHFNAPNGVTVHPTTGEIFVTDGHWNSRICSLQTNQGGIATTRMANTKNGLTSVSSASSSSSSCVISSPISAPSRRWTVASIPLHPCTSSSSTSSRVRSRLNTWWSAVRHSGPRYDHSPAMWPLRLPTSPIIMEQINTHQQATRDPSLTDALVLVDEELHILRLIPLTGSHRGEISTLTGSFGLSGLGEGWSSDGRFLFPQSIISIRHPFVETSRREGLRIDGGYRSMSMKDRQVILVADTGNDRLCLVNLIAKEEIRLEKRKQRMLRRQMRALRSSRPAVGAASSSSLEPPATADSDDTDSDDSDSDDDGDSGPFVGHVETVTIRSRLPKSIEKNFIAIPWTPFSEMMNNQQQQQQQIDETSSYSSSYSSSSHSCVGSTSSISSSSSGSVSSSDSTVQSRPMPLPACPYVHRGQNTYLRKLCVTSQGKVIGLNRLGIVLMTWRRERREEEDQQ